MLNVIGSAQHELRLAGYSFTSPQVVEALIAAYERNVDVQVLVDGKANRGRSSQIAMHLVANAGIPIRTISASAIHHDKYIVVDGPHRGDRQLQLHPGRRALEQRERAGGLERSPGGRAPTSKHWQSRWTQGAELRE